MIRALHRGATKRKFAPAASQPQTGVPSQLLPVIFLNKSTTNITSGSSKPLPSLICLVINGLFAASPVNSVGLHHLCEIFRRNSEYSARYAHGFVPASWKLLQRDRRTASSDRMTYSNAMISRLVRLQALALLLVSRSSYRRGKHSFRSSCSPAVNQSSSHL